MVLDRSGLDSLAKRIGPDALRAILANAATDLAHHGELTAKATTPQVTGNARRSTVSDVVSEEKRVMGRYPYLNWLDKGEDGRGRKMRSRPGGYQIRSRTRDEVRAMARAILAKALKDGPG